jgi:uncharacterized protein
MLWRRVDSPGHDACRLEESETGWRLDGTAVFLEDGMPARLTYHVACDRAWRTQQGQVHGWLGPQRVELSIGRAGPLVWTLNGSALSNLKDCVDLDLGFTPATNLLPLRRLALAVGEVRDAPAAWLNLPDMTLEVLDQRYERRGESTYWYEAPRFQYAALLEVDPTGFIRRYPGLWDSEI